MFSLRPDEPNVNSGPDFTSLILVSAWIAVDIDPRCDVNFWNDLSEYSCFDDELLFERDTEFRVTTKKAEPQLETVNNNNKNNFGAHFAVIVEVELFQFVILIGC